ncbi:hypothetical protein EWB00_000907 [Schistosoma japonicum]|uniref:Uncharacterized protein n=1 Tax=Schistosoma japonicum TaxID=6182 RepID=A0A4Z2DHM1_SCHJA|nr:hypothetical protein EWB00_000907 [Schistosoma japonicum]
MSSMSSILIYSDFIKMPTTTMIDNNSCMKLNRISMNKSIHQHTSRNSLQSSYPIELTNKNYYSLQNIQPINKQTLTKYPSFKLSQHNQLALVTNLFNSQCLKYFYQSYSTHVIVCKYPVNVSIQSMNKHQIPNINLIQLNELWQSIGWGYLIAIAKRNNQLPNSYESICLVLCQPITFKQLWNGYIMLPNYINHNYVTNSYYMNDEIIHYHIKQIHRNFHDTLHYSHCVIMTLQDTSNVVQINQQKLDKKSLFQRIFIKSLNKKSRDHSKKQFCLNQSITINNETVDYYVCKIESMESGTNWRIDQQSIEFFTELDELISNAVAFRYLPESEKQWPIQKQKHLCKYKTSTFPTHNNSTQCLKSQISLPCLFRHIYSLSKDDLQTMRTVYGFEV